MLHYDLVLDQKILILTPDGPLDAADFERLSRVVDPIVASNGTFAGILISARTFPGWASFDAMLSHLKFVAGHHRHFARIAVVTDGGFLRVLSGIASPLVKPELKIFESGTEDRAMAWLESDDHSSLPR